MVGARCPWCGNDPHGEKYFVKSRHLMTVFTIFKCKSCGKHSQTNLKRHFIFMIPLMAVAFLFGRDILNAPYPMLGKIGIWTVAVVFMGLFYVYYYRIVGLNKVEIDSNQEPIIRHE